MDSVIGAADRQVIAVWIPGQRGGAGIQLQAYWFGFNQQCVNNHVWGNTIYDVQDRPIELYVGRLRKKLATEATRSTGCPAAARCSRPARNCSAASR